MTIHRKYGKRLISKTYLTGNIMSIFYCLVYLALFQVIFWLLSLLLVKNLFVFHLISKEHALKLFLDFSLPAAKRKEPTFGLVKRILNARKLIKRCMA